MDRSSEQINDILKSLIREDTEFDAHEMAYGVYRGPFLSFFRKLDKWKNDALLAHYQQTFNLWVQEILENRARRFEKLTMFQMLLFLGFATLPDEKRSRIKKKFKTGLWRMGKHYDSDILVQLIGKGNQQAFDTTYEKLEQPILNILLKKGFKLQDEEEDKKILKEIYGEALSVLKNNVVKKSLKLPMKANMVTYLSRVFQNLTSNEFKKRSRYFHVDQDSTLEYLAEKAKPEKDTYVDKLIEEWGLRYPQYEFKNAADLLYRLLAKLKEPEYCRKLLIEHYLYELPYKKLAERYEITSNALRQRVFNCLARLRNILNQERNDLQE
jgi:RNA polymerase sigma factor (sigma-70 family)